MDQRAALRRKGPGADMLAMTATPIPRTLALSVYGDVSLSQIRHRPRAGAGVSTKVVTPDNLDLAWGAVRDAVAAGQQAYGQSGYAQPAYGQPVVGAPKQWIVAMLLAFFLGALGIHNFYLGYTSKGIIQLILTITMIGAPIAAIWALIEFVLILAHSGSYAYDAQGQPLQ